MIANVALTVGGILLIGLTLSDVFSTVVVPGGSNAVLRVARRLSQIMLPIWKAVRGRRRGLSTVFAPTMLVGSFLIWLLLLNVGFGMIGYASRHSFNPPLKSFWDALYVLGSALVTVGLSITNPTGASRWIVLAAAFCGLAVITMAVTYLLEVQNSVAARDTGIIKLNTSAGDPPSALALLEKFARIDNQPALPELLKEGRNWCATVRQSHSSHPSLIYFQSVGTGAGWPAALGVLLDLALIAERILAARELRGPAILLREEGNRMAKELTSLLNLDRVPVAETSREFASICERLRDAGYRVKDIDPQPVSTLRCDHEACVRALAQHLGRPTAVLVP
jgi:hypothetical protein